jgi:hypothetical protein
MRRERRKPTRAEWASITSSRPVVRRIPKPAFVEDSSAAWDNAKRMFDAATCQAPPPFRPELTNESKASEGGSWT